MGIFIKSKWLTAIIHLGIWLMLLFIPYMMFPHEASTYWNDLPRIAFSYLQYAIVFYANYFLLINHYFFKKKFVAFFLWNAVLIVAMLWFNDIFREELMPPKPPMDDNAIHKRPEPIASFFIWKDMLSLIISVIFSLALRVTENWIKTEARTKERENKHLQSELAHLRYQVQPHFFFNSLNNIYSLISISPERAQESVHGLSKLMRYMLYDTSRENVLLSEEINFLKNYIQLMDLRQSDKMKTTADFPEVMGKDVHVAPLLFIPLIENAYKHGVSATQPSFIQFKMTLDNDTLLFESENSYFPKSQADVSGSGIGLENLQKRLELLYPHKHEFSHAQNGDTYQVKLKLYLSKPSA